MLAEAVRLVLTWVAYAVVFAAALWIVGWPAAWAMGRRGGRPWMIWLVAIAVVAAATPPLAADLERRQRIAKARGDVLRLGKAVAAYAAHCGGPPATGAPADDCRVASGAVRGAFPAALLVPQRNARDVEAGPFLGWIPRLPPGWTGAGGRYAYTVDGDRGTGVCATGDGVVADSRGTGECQTQGP